MTFPFAIERISQLTDLNQINANQAEISQELITLWSLLLQLADKELQMYAIPLITETMTGSQNTLKTSVNSILNAWK